MKYKRRKGSKLKGLFKALFVISLIVIAAFIGKAISKERFDFGTTIQGVDCSFKTVDQAISAIQKSIDEQYVTFTFYGGKEYQFQCKEIDIRVNGTEELTGFLNSQKMDGEEDFSFKNGFLLDKEKLKECLKKIPDLNEQNMTMPQNAYLDENFKIIPEKLGNYINFGEALDYATNCLESGMQEVDFSVITQTFPDILSNDKRLLQQEEQANRLLNSSITFNLLDGSSVVFDEEIFGKCIKNSSVEDYEANLNDCIEQFVNTTLLNEVNEHSQQINFSATDQDNLVVIKTKGDIHPKLDVKAEKSQIIHELEVGGNYVRNPIYENKRNVKTNKTYIEIDITRQKLWYYLDGECILNTECITGCLNKGNSTPTGIYFLNNKTTNTYLKGYNKDGSLKYKSFVNYWMPFYKGYGLHDANWKKENEYVVDTYINNGSRGCVNLRYEVAKFIYTNIDNSTPIIIYNS